MTKAVILLCIISFTIYTVETLSHSLSLIVWKSRQYSLTSSVFNVVALTARFAQMFQAPLLGILVDVSVSQGTEPTGYFRMILLSATAGVLFAIAILPTFFNIFLRIVERVSVKGSIAKGLLTGIDPGKIHSLRQFRQIPSRSMLSGISALWKYKYLLLTNILVSSIYSVGVLSAYYAAVASPGNRLGIAGFSGSINGVASLVLILFFDPRVSVITDEVYKGKREYSDLMLVVVMLILSRLIGTLLGQVLFTPAAQWILLLFNFLTD